MTLNRDPRYPHLCPGWPCAICRWLQRKYPGFRYESGGESGRVQVGSTRAMTSAPTLTTSPATQEHG